MIYILFVIIIRFISVRGLFQTQLFFIKWHATGEWAVIFVKMSDFCKFCVTLPSFF